MGDRDEEPLMQPVPISLNRVRMISPFLLVDAAV
jgi:hypothetical protein